MRTLEGPNAAGILFETEPLEPARFLERPNRFVVRFRRKGSDGLAYLANPGRLGEILLPDTTLLLARRAHTRMGWEALGATWLQRWPGDCGRSVLLNAARMNQLAEIVLRQRLIPELSDYSVAAREYRYRGSRIDFLLKKGTRSCLLEVKSVTLVEHGLGFFPDAVTARGRRHLETLAEAAGSQQAGVLFVVQGDADRFLPDFHNDLEFARAFGAARKDVAIHAVAFNPILTADRRLRFEGRPQQLAVPAEALTAGLNDGGLYILLTELARDTRIEVGRLGTTHFHRGWYAYAGSARRNLSQRIARHQRARKKLHYHIDYLRAWSAWARAYPIRAAPLGECELARELQRISAGPVQGFGCSDCGCGSHLFLFRQPPQHMPAFQELLTRLRHRSGA